MPQTRAQCAGVRVAAMIVLKLCSDVLGRLRRTKSSPSRAADVGAGKAQLSRSSGQPWTAPRSLTLTANCAMAAA